MNARTSWALFQTHTSAKSRGPRAGQLHLQLGVHKFDKRASASFSRSPIKILNEPGPTTEPCDGPASCLAQLEPAKSPDEASSKKGSFSTSARGTAQFPAGAVVIVESPPLSEKKTNKVHLFLDQHMAAFITPEFRQLCPQLDRGV